MIGEFLKQLFGIDVPLDGDTRVKTTLVGMWGYAWLAIPLLILVLVFFVWVYRRDARQLGRGQTFALWTLRGLAAVVVLLVLLKPVLHIVVDEVKLPVVALFIDESTSMDLPDALDSPLLARHPGATREDRSRVASAQRAVLKLKEKLQSTHRIEVFKFSDTLMPVMDIALKPEGVPTARELSDQENKRLLGSLKTTGEHTDIGDCLLQAVERYKVGNPSAMIVFSDGRRTGGESLERVAEEGQAHQMTFHTVAFGTKEPLRDLALVDLVTPSEAPLGDVLAMRITVVNHIRPGLTIALKLQEEDANPKRKQDSPMDPALLRPIIIEKQVTLESGRNDVVLTTIPKVEGERKFTITAPQFPDELTYENNSAQAHVNIVKKTLRVLFIAGIPTIEYHYIVPSLIRDPIIDVSCWLQDADVTYRQQGKKIIERLPRTGEEWNEYDVVILYDIDPNRFDNQQEAALEQLVSKGGGALFIAGRSHGMDKLLQVRTDKMRALLPVEIDANRHPRYEQHFTAPFRLLMTPEARRHPVFMLELDDAANDKVWNSLPAFYWHHPVLSVKPTAIPLLKKVLPEGTVSDRGDVIMAMQRYGEGVTFYTGINELWRWRFPHGNYDYDRFWNQIVRYLGETRLLGSQKQVVLRTDKKLYAPGETVKILLAVLDPALFKQLQNAELLATVTDQDGAEYKLPLARDASGRSEYRGSYPVRRVGSYQLRVNHRLAEGTSDEKKLFDEKQHFDVRLQSLEFSDTTADLDAMAELAAHTGGKAYNHHNMQELEELVAHIPRKEQLMPRETDQEIWDTPFFLLIFLGLVTTEWSLRKRWGLL